MTSAALNAAHTLAVHEQASHDHAFIDLCSMTSRCLGQSLRETAGIDLPILWREKSAPARTKGRLQLAHLNRLKPAKVLRALLCRPCRCRSLWLDQHEQSVLLELDVDPCLLLEAGRIRAKQIATRKR
jgi:hypothetical protein